MTQGSAKGRLSELPLFRTYRSETILWGVVLLLLVLHLSTALQRAINWDEYYHYSLLEVFARGEYVQPLQTLYVRAFAWVTDIPGSEIDHIIVVRLFMFGCLAVTALSIAGIVTSLSSRTTGLICAACYLSAGLVLHHGTAFRTDIMTAALLSAALWLLATSRLSWKSISLMGFLVGIAGMVTIKAILWLPAFAGMGLIRWHSEGWKPLLLARLLFATVMAGLTFVAVYFFHSESVAPIPDTAAGTLINSASRRMFVVPYFEKAPVILTAAFTALPLAILVIALPFVLLKSHQAPARKLGVLGLWGLVLVPLVYVNSYPYFYTFILPPLAVSIYLAVDAGLKRYSAVGIAIVLGFNGVLNWAVDERGILQNQRLVLDVIKQTIPGPVTYFDCCASIATWPNGNGFRTAWGVDQYLAAGRPAFRARMEAEPVPLLIAGGWARQAFQKSGRIDDFLPEDAHALRETYVQFWGPLYLAGVQLGPFQQKAWSALVPGAYTVRGSLTIDGVQFADGDVLNVERGTMAIQETSGAPALLIWGRQIEKPKMAPPTSLWTGWVE